MPKKRPTIKNERKYEALKGQGHVQGARGEDRERSEVIGARRQAIGLRGGCIARRNDRTEEGGRTEGRQGDLPETQIVDGRG